MDGEYEEIIPAEYPTNLIDKDWSQRKCYYLKGSQEYMKKVHEMEVKDDDVWVLTLAKCGTTWMQELVWLVTYDFDFETAKQVDLELRTPYMGFDFKINRDPETALNPVKDLPSPRVIKSHSPLPLLPKQLWTKKPKVIFVTRNPKDAAVSTYYFCRTMGVSMDKTLDEFIKIYLEKYMKINAPFDYFVEAYSLRNEPWVYYTSFEKMKSNLRQVIEDVCKFLGKGITEDQMQQMLKHLSFEEMKNNPMVQHHWEVRQIRNVLQQPYEEHPFIREGGVNRHKEVLSEDNIQLFDKWIKEQESKHNVTMDELLLLNEINSK